MTAPASDRAARIYITGFMGSGKSTVGPLLGASLGYAFIDLDTVIEAGEGKSIAEIFRGKGEQEFRALERSALRLLSARSNIVVATGGGALTDPGSLAIVRQSGLSVYLEVPVDALIARLRGRKGRPMISASDGSPLDPEELRDRITSLFLLREPVYRRADIIVDAASGSPRDTVAAILDALRVLRGTH